MSTHLGLFAIAYPPRCLEAEGASDNDDDAHSFPVSSKNERPFRDPAAFISAPTYGPIREGLVHEPIRPFRMNIERRLFRLRRLSSSSHSVGIRPRNTNAPLRTPRSATAAPFPGRHRRPGKKIENQTEQPSAIGANYIHQTDSSSRTTVGTTSENETDGRMGCSAIPECVIPEHAWLGKERLDDEKNIYISNGYTQAFEWNTARLAKRNDSFRRPRTLAVSRQERQESEKTSNEPML